MEGEPCPHVSGLIGRQLPPAHLGGPSPQPCPCPTPLPRRGWSGLVELESERGAPSSGWAGGSPPRRSTKSRAWCGLPCASAHLASGHTVFPWSPDFKLLLGPPRPGEAVTALLSPHSAQAAVARPSEPTSPGFSPSALKTHFQPTGGATALPPIMEGVWGRGPWSLDLPPRISLTPAHAIHPGPPRVCMGIPPGTWM